MLTRKIMAVRVFATISAFTAQIEEMGSDSATKAVTR